MSISASTLRRLAALNLAPQAMAEVLSIIADLTAVEEARKAKDRARKFRGDSEEIPRNETGKSTDVSVENPVPHASAPAEPKITNSSEPLEKQESKKVSKSTTPSASRGTRIPDGFVPDIEAAVAEGMNRSQAEREAEKFRDWWAAAPGAKGLKADWPATWRTWYRKRLEDYPARAGPPQKAGNGTGFNGKETLGDILNAARAQIAAKDQHGRPALELVALPAGRGGDGRGNHEALDGLPGSADRPQGDSHDLLRRIRESSAGRH